MPVKKFRIEISNHHIYKSIFKGVAYREFFLIKNIFFSMSHNFESFKIKERCLYKKLFT